MSTSKCNVLECEQNAAGKCHCQIFKLCSTHLEDSDIIEQLGKLYDKNCVLAASITIERNTNEIRDLIESKKILCDDATKHITKIESELKKYLKEIDQKIEVLEKDNKILLAKVPEPNQQNSKHSPLSCENGQSYYKRAHNSQLISLKMNIRVSQKATLIESYNKIIEEPYKFVNEDTENKIQLNLDQIEGEEVAGSTPLTASSIHEETSDNFSDSQDIFVIIDANSAIIDIRKEFSNHLINACGCKLCSRLFGIEGKIKECGCITCEKCILNRLSFEA